MVSCSMLDDIMVMWHELVDDMRDPAYAGEKLDSFSCLHTEKLAIGLGIISAVASKPIRVSKNLRMCIDCHTSLSSYPKLSKEKFL